MLTEPLAALAFVNGLPCAGVHSGGVAKEHISALVDHGLGKLNALVGGGKVAGVDHIQSGDGFAPSCCPT